MKATQVANSYHPDTQARVTIHHEYRLKRISIENKGLSRDVLSRPAHQKTVV
jgi:hypothetical protein